MKNNFRTITLEITENCNLSCVYCYEHNKSIRNMSFNTAKSILDKELTKTAKEKDESIIIELFGGEPFLNFELIKEIVEYVLNFYKGDIHFFATTNGTLIHNDIQEWLIKHKKCFTIGLSLDGTRQAHNINRCGSFDEIDLNFFLKEYPLQPIKMTISKESLPYLAESVKFIHSLGFIVECNLAYMIDWTSPTIKSILVNQLNLLIDYYLNNPNAPKCKMMSFNLEVLSIPYDKIDVTQKYCGTGTNMIYYDINGIAYPCQLFSPLSAGKKAIKLSDININDEIPKYKLDSKCANCFYLRICPSCLGSNYLSTGNLYKQDNERCKLYKLIFAANAKLKALQWDKGQLNLSPDEEQALLRSIILIQKENINKE